MDNMFTPTLDWGNELLTSLWWIAKAWVIAAVATLVILCADPSVHHLGQTVLAHHRRLLHRSGERQGLDLAGRCCCCR